jgi:putative ABC transport system substrate-binding protein
MKTVLVLIGCIFASIHFAEAQHATKITRIGFLTAGDAARQFTPSEAIRLALRELGYIEGQNIAIDYRYAEGNLDRAPQLAAELVRLKVDMIVVAGGYGWIQAAKDATKTIPIVMVGAGIDPVTAGFIKSLAHPGGNVTGLTLINRELGGKRLELLKETIPKLARVAVFYDPANRTSVPDVKEVLPVAARALGLTLRVWEIRGYGRFRESIRRARQGAPGWTLCAPLGCANVR